MHSLLLPVLAAFPLTAPAFDDEPTLDDRLERLVATLEDERVQNHIPGFALAVVYHDEIVLAHGFGLADVEAASAVEPDTIFAIGSSTKAFTSTVIGMLQDDGVMRYDDPIVDYLPFFELPIDASKVKGDATVTIRDLLSHRTGFTRMSMAWFGNEVPVQTILETVTHAEPWAGFREKFLYNNVMFLAAGVASGVAAESDWETLVRTRVFAPLGMTSSTLRVSEAQKDERLALGYAWNADTEAFDRKQMVDISNIGPAGSINSNVLDMAQWLRFQLGNGELDGKRLISAAALKETRTPTTPIGGNVSYGLGWMIREFMDQPVIEHGGNIDGFSSTVAFMPDADVGFVLLANVNVSPIQQSAIRTVFDAMLGEFEEPVVAEPGDFDPFIGSYAANFASFRDAEFEVLVQNGNLAVDVPGQMVFELHAPNDEDKWVFRFTDEISVSFERDEAGGVVGMKMYQSGMTFDLPRKGVEVALEAPLEAFEALLGTYRVDELDGDVEAVIQGGHLALDIPGQMVFELHLPDADGWRKFRVTDEVAVRFNEDGGQVVSFTMNERGKMREASRVDAQADPEALAVPSVEEFLALRGKGGTARLLEKHGTLRMSGKVWLAQSGVEGTFQLEARLDPRAYRLELDFGAFGARSMGSDGERAWTYHRAQGLTRLSGQQGIETVRGHPSILDGDWAETFDAVKVLRVEPQGDREVIVAELLWGEQEPRTVYVDVDTGQVARMDYTMSEGTIHVPFTTLFDDYREVDGAQVAHRSIERSEMTGKAVQTTEKIELGVELADDFYAYRGAKD